MDKDLIKLVEPVMKYLSENHNPHTAIIMDSTTAEMVEGQAMHRTAKFLKD